MTLISTLNICNIFSSFLLQRYSCIWQQICEGIRGLNFNQALIWLPLTKVVWYKNSYISLAVMHGSIHSNNMYFVVDNCFIWDDQIWSFQRLIVWLSFRQILRFRGRLIMDIVLFQWFRNWSQWNVTLCFHFTFWKKSVHT